MNMKKVWMWAMMVALVLIAGKSYAAGPYTQTVNGIVWTYCVIDGCASVGGE